MRRLLIGTIAITILCTACQGPKKRLNAPPHGPIADNSQLRPMIEHMVDNGLLADMTISDVHFLPHRARLNALGEERLARLASLMEEYGGEIRFNTDLTDDELIEQRTEAIVEFLAAAGLDTHMEVLVRELPGGRGMSATEAILIKLHEATYTPPDKKQAP